MEANLKFNLNTVADELRYYQCVNSESMAIALHEIVYNLRKKIQWKAERNPKLDPSDLVFEMIAEIIESHDIQMNKIL